MSKSVCPLPGTFDIYHETCDVKSTLVRVRSCGSGDQGGTPGVLRHLTKFYNLVHDVQVESLSRLLDIPLIQRKSGYKANRLLTQYTVRMATLDSARELA